MDNVRVEPSKNTKFYFIGVGGGAMKNTCHGRFVVWNRMGLGGYNFVRQHGELANRLDQATVPVRVGDVVVEISGSLPVDLKNPGLSIKAGRITSFVNNEAILEEIKYPCSNLPESVVKGLSIYHNRDGHYFVSEEATDVAELYPA